MHNKNEWFVTDCPGVCYVAAVLVTANNVFAVVRQVQKSVLLATCYRHCCRVVAQNGDNRMQGEIDRKFKLMREDFSSPSRSHRFYYYLNFYFYILFLLWIYL